MMLRARQRWTLATMEKRLRVSEPRLTAMFLMFARLTRDEAPGGAEAMSRFRGRRRRSRLWSYLPLGVAAALIGLGAAVSGSASPSCPPIGSTRTAGLTRPAPATCRRPPQHATFPEPPGR